MLPDFDPQRKSLKHNYLFNVLDGGFFGFALGFASFSTVIPLFVSTMTGSALLIGLIPALHNIGWQLPQLLVARYITGLERIKPTVMLLTIQERLPFLGLAVVAWLIPSIGLKAALVFTFLLLAWQGLGGGLTANPWQNMIGRVIPDDHRATFYGFQGAAANLLASLGAISAGYILESIAYPINYTLCFLAAISLMIVSYFMIKQTIEHPRPVVTSDLLKNNYWKQVLAVLKNDTNFDWYLITRCIMQFALMAAAFYTVYAVNLLGMSKSLSGYMASVLMLTQVVANPILGRLADRSSRRFVLAIGALCASLSALLAYLAPNYLWFFAVSILIGIAYTSYWTIGLAITVEFGDEQNRSMYIGLANTLIAPVAIAALLLGGWIADSFGYPVTFLVAAGSGFIASAVYLLYLRDPSRRKPLNKI